MKLTSEQAQTVGAIKERLKLRKAKQVIYEAEGPKPKGVRARLRPKVTEDLEQLLAIVDSLTRPNK